MIDRSGCPAEQHGSKYAYGHFNCRCPDARAVESAYRKQRRSLKRTDRADVAAVGAMRRLQALAHLCYGVDELAVRSTLARYTLVAIRSGTRPWITPRSRAEIDRLWRELTAAANRGRRGFNEQARQHAQRCGWPGVLDWDGLDIDDPNVQPAVEIGAEVRSMHANREEMRHLLLLKESPEHVAKRLGLAPKTVFEYAAKVLPKTYSRGRGSAA